MADPQAALRQWIVEGLNKKGHGSGRELARRIGVGPEVLTRMKNTDGLKETRRIEAHMIPAIAEFFETIPPGFEEVANLKCVTCAVSAKNVVVIDGQGAQKAMPDKGKSVTVNIDPPQNSTLVIGDNNTVTTNNTQVIGTGSQLTPEDTLKLNAAVEDVAAARGSSADEVRRELCSALQIADAALITSAIYPAAEKILASWKEDAVRDAVNEKGG